MAFFLLVILFVLYVTMNGNLPKYAAFAGYTGK